MIPMEVIVGAGSVVTGFVMKAVAQGMKNKQELFKMALQKQEANTASADAAAKRGSPWTRKAAAMIILVVAFVGLFVVAMVPSIPVSIISEVPEKSLLFGLIKWGGGLQVTEAGGFVMAPWFKYSVISVVHFLFGTGAAK